VFLESNTLRTINVPPNYEVHHLVDRTQVLEIGVIVLGKDKVVNSLEGSATKWGKGTLFVLGEDDVDTIEESGMGRI